MRPALLIGLAVAGVVATVGGVVAVQWATISWRRIGREALGQVVIIDGIWIACGLVACWRRPNNLVGPLVTAFGFVDMSQELYWDAALPFTIAPLVSAFTIAIAIHLFLAYPSGRLTTAPQRALVGSRTGPPSSWHR